MYVELNSAMKKRETTKAIGVPMVTGNVVMKDAKDSMMLTAVSQPDEVSEGRQVYI